MSMSAARRCSRWAWCRCNRQIGLSRYFFWKETAMAQLGTGKYTYELIPDFFKSPDGEPFGLISRVAADSQDRIYVFQRRDPPVVVFDRDGKYLGAWGACEVTDPHGLKIIGDTVYTTDRSDSVTKSFTLDGKPQMERGQGGQHSATGDVANALAHSRTRPCSKPAPPTRRRTLQPSDRNDPAPERRHLCDRRLPQRPRAPLYQ